MTRTTPSGDWLFRANKNSTSKSNSSPTTNGAGQKNEATINAKFATCCRSYASCSQPVNVVLPFGIESVKNGVMPKNMTPSFGIQYVGGISSYRWLNELAFALPGDPGAPCR